MVKLRRDFNPPPNRQLKGSAVLILSIVSAGIIGLTAVSIAKVNSIAMNSVNSNRIALQAQSYADGRLNMLKLIGYEDLQGMPRTSIMNSKGFEEEVVLGNETESPENSNILKRDITVNIYKNKENIPRIPVVLPRYSKTETSTSNGSWIDIPASGIAPADGIIIVTSNYNGSISIKTNGILRTEASGRSKYGQGYISATSAVAKGESYVVSGGRIIQFFKIN